MIQLTDIFKYISIGIISVAIVWLAGLQFYLFLLVKFYKKRGIDINHAGKEDSRKAKLMRVFIGESDRWSGEPLFAAIVKKLRMIDIAGATVYRGIYGYGAKGHTHKESFLHLSRDLPIMISAIDSPERISAAVEAVEEMLTDGLIVVSDVEMTRIVRSAPGVEVQSGATNPS